MFGERVHVALAEENFVALRSWMPELPEEYCPSFRNSYPQQFNKLVGPIRMMDGNWGWSCNLKKSSQELGMEQQRLLYVLGSSMIELSLNGIVQRAFGMSIERESCERLRYHIRETLHEELLQFLESEKKNKSMDTSDNMKVDMKKVHFPVKGVTIARSLAFGMIQMGERTRISDRASPIL